MIKQLVVPVAFLLLLFGGVFVASQWADQSSSQTDNPIDAPKALQAFAVADAVPVTIVTDSEGKSFKLDENLPDKTLITFWGSVCGECGETIQTIETFRSAHPDFRTIYINTNESAATAETIKKYDTRAETYFDRDGSVAVQWRATMPATYFIGRGQIQFFFPGRINEELLKTLTEL